MTDKEKLEKIKKLADAMYYAAGHLEPTVGSGERLRKTMGEYHEFIIYEYHKEYPVSKDLDKEMDNYLASVFSEEMDGGKPRFTTWFRALRKTAIHFANWQKDKFTALLNAEKDKTSIGLNEWENGIEHGRMEVINSLTKKLEEL